MQVLYADSIMYWPNKSHCVYDRRLGECRDVFLQARRDVIRYRPDLERSMHILTSATIMTGSYLRQMGSALVRKERPGLWTSRGEAVLPTSLLSLIGPKQTSCLLKCMNSSSRESHVQKNKEHQRNLHA
jgi:hypothetical protein